MRLTHHGLVGGTLLPVLVDEARVTDLVHIQGQRQCHCKQKHRRLTYQGKQSIYFQDMSQLLHMGTKCYT